jgi:hypothetical protein
MQRYHIQNWRPNNPAIKWKSASRVANGHTDIWYSILFGNSNIDKYIVDIEEVKE